MIFDLSPEKSKNKSMCTESWDSQPVSSNCAGVEKKFGGECAS